MAPISTSRDHDVEAQRDVLQPHRASYHLTHCYPLGWNVLTAFIKVLEDDIHGRTSNPSEMGNETSRLSSDLAQTAILRSLGTALFTPALAFQVRRVILIPSRIPGEEGAEEVVTYETGIHQSGRTTQTPTRVEHGEVQSNADTPARHVVDLNLGKSPMPP